MKSHQDEKLLTPLALQEGKYYTVGGACVIKNALLVERLRYVNPNQAVYFRSSY